MLQPPEPFNFEKPKTWKFWIKRFERYRVASKLSEESGKHQINQLIIAWVEKLIKFFQRFCSRKLEQLNSKQLKSSVKVILLQQKL